LNDSNLFVPRTYPPSGGHLHEKFFHAAGAVRGGSFKHREPIAVRYILSPGVHKIDLATLIVVPARTSISFDRGG